MHLYLGGRPILDEETREKIASGQLGRFLTRLLLHGCDDNAEKWLDMVEARQRNVRAMLQTVTNWRETFTSLRWVAFYGVENYEAHDERVAGLELMGIEVALHQ